MSFKAGFVGLIGRANAGKSTFLNQVIGEKVAIVTRKPQTTRRRAIGVYTDDEAQIIFVDAPGVVQAEKGLNKFLQQEYEEIIDESDVLIALLNIDEKNPARLDEIIDLVSKSGKPWIAVITKNDLPKYNRVLILKEKLEKYGVPVFSISAVKAPEQVKEDLFPELKGMLPESPQPLYDPELCTTQNVRELTEEIIREKCFLSLHQEVPYGLAVSVRKFIENEGPTTKIFADIVLSKEGHRPMVVGQKGEGIRKIGTLARKDIEDLVGKKVYLDLHVRVKQNWMKKDNLLKELGYELSE